MTLLALARRAWKVYRHSITTDRTVEPFNFRILCRSPLVIYTTTPRQLANVFLMSRDIANHPAAPLDSKPHPSQYVAGALDQPVIRRRQNAAERGGSNRDV